MRKKYEEQLKLVYLIPNNKIGHELNKISQVIDENRKVCKLVHNDLTYYKDNSTGRCGLNAEQVLRCTILKKYQDLTYEDLEFYLSDSTTFKAFARLDMSKNPSKSTLQENIKAISAETWECINNILVDYSLNKKIETGNMTRTDATAVDTPVHYPTDSSLLKDAIRVITRLLVKGQNLPSRPGYAFSDHNRAAKKKDLHIKNCKKKKQHKTYKQLLKLSKNVVSYAEQAIPQLQNYQGPNEESTVTARMISDYLEYYKELLLRVIDQTTRRIIHGEAVPAKDKVVSLFECHTDIISKGQRETQFGHKVFITTGKSGIVLDCYLPRGNPNDADLFQKLLDREKKILNKTPRQKAMDGGFASKANLEAAKDEGVQDMVFAKKRGLKTLDMAKSDWVYKKLRNFRAGIEGLISVLKRAFGLDRCNWTDWEGYKQYVWSSIVTFNLQVLAKS